jgi:phospholipid N-methyltransferase
MTCGVSFAIIRAMKAATGLKSFWQVAVKDYVKVGTFFPSTKIASRTVARQIPENPEVIVEYGAGSGVVTRELLKRLPKHGRLISVEQNEAFIDALNEIGDPRLEVVHGDVIEFAKNLPALAPRGVDAVVSGIPFAFMKGHKCDAVVEYTRRALKNSGRFIVYQNTIKVGDVLKSHFPRVKWFLEPRNIMPYFIFVAGTRH